MPRALQVFLLIIVVGGWEALCWAARIWYVWAVLGALYYFFGPSTTIGLTWLPSLPSFPDWSFHMPALIGLIAFGGLLFWPFWLGIAVLLVVLAEYEQKMFSFLTTVAIAGIIYLLYGFTPVEVMWEHKILTASLIGGYFAVGAIWMLLRWGFFIQGLMDKASEVIAKYKGEQKVVETETGTKVFFDPDGNRKHGAMSDSQIATLAVVQPNTPEHRAPMFVAIANYLAVKGVQFPPKRAENKARILFWIGYWPFSMFWTLLNGWFKKVTTFIYNRLTGVLDKITHMVIEWNLRS